ncbi:MAG: D-alanine--D-alanine ligase [Deltaproteobacteria bacterium]|nr:D-alanine--D-alanine ligase [Deltaproteobacteria bacterium]
MTTNQWRGKRIGILMGGISKERDVSLRTGKAMASAFERLGYTVVPVDVRDDLVTRLRATPIDVAVIALHGTYGEDGCIQGLLEWLRIPYTGASVMGSAVAMDKVVCKHVAHDIGIPVADGHLFHAAVESVEECARRMTLALPVIVKPVREGSTIGVTIVQTPEALPDALRLAATSDEKVLIETFVTGQEVTVGWLGGTVLTPLEIAPKDGFYNFAAKYTKGMTEYILPARIPAATAAQLGAWTTRLCAVLDCRGMARADYMVRPDGRAVFLELNTIPGMTELSLVPQAAAYAGIAFDEVCDRVLQDVLPRERSR